MTQLQIPALTPNEEVTLRRVAFGESEVSVLRADDLARLYKLGLIEVGKDRPRLTAEGRQRFDALPKVAKSKSTGDPMAEMQELLDKVHRNAAAMAKPPPKARKKGK